MYIQCTVYIVSTLSINDVCNQHFGSILVRFECVGTGNSVRVCCKCVSICTICQIIRWFVFLLSLSLFFHPFLMHLSTERIFPFSHVCRSARKMQKNNIKTLHFASWATLISKRQPKREILNIEHTQGKREKENRLTFCYNVFPLWFGYNYICNNKKVFDLNITNNKFV